jgi:hypothetical protein
MRRKPLCGIGMAGMVLITATLAASQSPREAPAEDRTALSGAWRLNRELSDDPATLRSGGGGDDSDDPARSERRRGGGGMGRVGGMGGERPDPEQMKRVRAIMQSLMEPPANLIISVEETLVTFTDADGRSQRFATTNKKEKHQLDAGTVETKTKWDRDALVKEISLDGGTKVVETYSVTEMGQLQVAVKLESSRMGRPLTVRRVYDDVAPRPDDRLDAALLR